MTSKVEHTDILGNLITESSKLAVARHNSLVICSIIKMTDKMIRVESIIAKNNGRGGSGFLAYPKQSVVVDGPDVLAYILTKN
jgi:hypothetical protein